MSLAGPQVGTYSHRTPAAAIERDAGKETMDADSNNPIPARPRTPTRVLLAALAAVTALSGQVLTMAPAAQADASGPPRPKPLFQEHGLHEFTQDGTFTPPRGVTSVFVQAWGAGGGGGGGEGSGMGIRRGGHDGGGGGGGGFAWCIVHISSLRTYMVHLGVGGTGGTGGTTQGAPGTSNPGVKGTDGTPTTLTALNSTVEVSAGGGTGGGGGGAAQGAPGTGGTGTCRTDGVTRPGGAGVNDILGGDIADGIVGPPTGDGVGGDGGRAGGAQGEPGDPGQNGGNGYLVVWW